MEKRAGAVIILDVTFTRRASTTHVTYTLEKHTPFGVITASKTVRLGRATGVGTSSMDGEMYTTLTSRINSEEADRLLEGGANTAFGG